MKLKTNDRQAITRDYMSLYTANFFESLVDHTKTV